MNLTMILLRAIDVALILLCATSALLFIGNAWLRYDYDRNPAYRLKVLARKMQNPHHVSAPRWAALVLLIGVAWMVARLWPAR